MEFFTVTFICLSFPQNTNTAMILFLVLYGGGKKQGQNSQQYHIFYFWFCAIVPFEHSRQGIYQRIFHTTNMLGLEIKVGQYRIHLNE